MRNTPYMSGYKNGVEVRIKDRRAFVSRRPDGGFRIEAHKVDKGRYWKPANCKRLHNAKVITVVGFSEEAMMGIIQAVHKLMTDPHYKTKKK